MRENIIINNKKRQALQNKLNHHVCKFANKFLVVRLGASAIAVFIVANLSSNFSWSLWMHKRLANTGLTTSVMSEIYGGLHMHFVPTFVVCATNIYRFASQLRPARFGTGTVNWSDARNCTKKTTWIVYRFEFVLSPFTVFLVGSLRCCSVISYPNIQLNMMVEHLYPFKTMRPGVAVMATRVAITSAALYVHAAASRHLSHNWERAQW